MLNIQSVVAEMEEILHRLIGEDIELETSSVRTWDWSRPIEPNRAGNHESGRQRARCHARGGRLTIETANVDLDKSFSHSPVMLSPGPYVMLAVTDNGCGMESKPRPNLRTVLYDQGKGKGTGLGLATVYGIVKQSDGYIWVYSEPGRGTSFKIICLAYWEEPTQGRDRRLDGQACRRDRNDSTGGR